MLRQAHGPTAKIPGAEVRLDGHRYAINVRLTALGSVTLEPRIDLHNATYDAVLFFCSNRNARQFMERLQDKHRWSNVVIREMPTPEPFPRQPPRPAELLVSNLLDSRTAVAACGPIAGHP